MQDGITPMARPKAKAPARRYHLSGQAIVTIEDRTGRISGFGSGNLAPEDHFCSSNRLAFVRLSS